MDQPRYDVLTVADLCVDFILTGPDVTPLFGQGEKIVPEYRLEMGGSCSLFATQAAKLGLRTGVVGVVGQDAFGELIVETLRAAGVTTDYIARSPSIPTGVTVILAMPADRAMLTCLGGIDAVDVSHVTDALLGSTRHLHVGSYFLLKRLQPDLAAIVEAARRSGASVSLDTNWDPDNTWKHGLPELLPLVDVFLPNENEALAISGEPTVERAALSLGRTVPVVAVKLGAEGALVCSNGSITRVPGVPAEPVDAVGAGDAFDAGFVAALLAGETPERAARLGCACGALSTRAAGGERGQATGEEAAAAAAATRLDRTVSRR